MSGISTKITAYFAIFFTLQLSLIVATIKAENNRPVETRRPNVILFVGDDFGYGDLSVYGHPTQEWGAIDEMAIKGIRFTQFYATSIFCSPSRAAILTGRLPLRIGAYGQKPVFMPGHSNGLPLSEETVAESLQQAGYTTGMVGKWHLGININNYTDHYYFPQNQGFDFVGTFLPFTLEDTCDEDKHYRFQPKRSKCFLFYNKTIIQQPINLDRLTSDMVQDAKAFIHNSGDRPFFLYFPFPQTHIAFFNHPDLANKSRRGYYGDQVNEMQWGVGEILQLIRDLGKEENTMSMFISDHGGQKELCLHGGNNGHFYGGKGNFYEGGVRIPAIIHWPGVIPSGRVSSAIMSTLDILPTFREIAGIRPNPNGMKLDGKSFADILFKPMEEKHHKTLLFFCNEHLVAARHKKYKIHFATVIPANKDDYTSLCTEGIPHKDHIMQINCDKYTFLKEPLIFNVEEDPGEDFPFHPQGHSNIIEDVKNEYEKLKGTLPKDRMRLFDLEYMTDSLIPCCNPPYCICNYSVKRK